MNDGDGKRRIKSLDNTIELVEALRQRGSATISELEAETTLTAGTIHTHLATLRDHRLVVKESDKYRLGPYFISLGEHVRNNYELYRAAKSDLDDLAADTGEVVHLFIEDNGRGIAIYEAFGSNAVGTTYHLQNREQPRVHLHCTAYGKSILSELPEERVDEILDQRGLVKKTPNTIVERSALKRELETVRERGYATNDEEEVMGIRAVGVPVLVGEELYGGISVSAPTTRLEGERFTEELPRKLVQTANVIQVKLSTNDHMR